MVTIRNDTDITKITNDDFVLRLECDINVESAKYTT